MNDTRKFYDDLAESYHLIFEDWDRSIARQAASLEAVLAPLLPQESFIIDAAAGIGTQTLALSSRGFRVAAFDISERSVSRARREATQRHFELIFGVADFRELPFRTGVADAVIACDNALPHLASISEIKTALLEFRRCIRPGGVVLISMRDYSVQPPGTHELKPYGERVWNGRRYSAEQEWLWEGACYRLILRIRPLDVEGDDNVLEVRTTYLAASISEVLRVMTDIGLTNITRLDEPYYQPLLVGTVGGAA